MSGKPSRDKGLRRERETVAMFRDWGLKAERVPLSGATHYRNNGGDVDVYKPGRDAPLVCEVKGRKTFPAYLAEWLGDNDFLILKGDRAEPMAVLPMRVLRELLGAKPCE